MSNPSKISRGTLMATLAITGSLLISGLSYWMGNVSERLRMNELEVTTVKANQITVSERLTRINDKLDKIIYGDLKISARYADTNL